MYKYFFIIFLFLSNLSLAEDFEVEDYSTPTEQTDNNYTDTIERLEHKINLLEKKLNSLAEDVEFRLKQLESKKTTPAENSGNKAKVKPDEKQAKVKFEEALFLIQDEKYIEAEESLSQFIDDYPNNTYTGNAYYWLGECFMLQKRYDKASLNYLQSFTKFPKNEKSDLSMFKLVKSLNLLGKKKEACQFLTKLKAKKATLSKSLQTLLQKELNNSKCSTK